MPDREKTSGSLLMGLAILRCLASERTALGMSQIAARTEVPKATAHRLLRTLGTLGYVTQRSGSRKYALNAAVLDFAYSLVRSFQPDRETLRSMHRRALEGRYGLTIQVLAEERPHTIETLGVPCLSHDEDEPSADQNSETEASIRTSTTLRGPQDAPRFAIVLTFPRDTEATHSPQTMAALTDEAAAALTNAYWPLLNISSSQ